MRLRSSHFLPLAPLALLAAGLLLASCSRRPPAPAPVTVVLSGSADMNAGGNAAIVRVYPLASDANFRRTPIAAFWQDDAAALGADLVGPAREVLLYPGETESFEIDPAGGAAFVGVAADLREPDANGWRAVYPISDVRGRRMAVTVDAGRLDVRVEG